MSEDTRPSGLQFEQAEAATPPTGAPRCSKCDREIQDRYYEQGGLTLCEACRDALVAEWSRGSGAGRFARATLYGLAAAALGTILDYAIGKLTGYEFGLIAIVIGLMVGAAVRAGSYRRGGWRYQALAMFLTYTSIVCTYVPDIWNTIREGMETAEAPHADAVTASDADGEGSTTVVAEPASGTASTASQAAEPAAAELAEANPAEPAESVGFVGAALTCVLAPLLILALAFAAPFFAGFENFMGWIIIAIGLYEAWKINKRPDREIRGPFTVAAPAAPEPPAQMGPV